jgi:hypothetical protein
MKRKLIDRAILLPQSSKIIIGCAFLFDYFLAGGCPYHFSIKIKANI